MGDWTPDDFLKSDLTSYDFVNNVDDIFDRSVLGAAFVTYAANSIINHFLAIFLDTPLAMFLAWVVVFVLTLVVFAYWGRFKSSFFAFIEDGSLLALLLVGVLVLLVGAVVHLDGFPG